MDGKRIIRGVDFGKDERTTVLVGKCMPNGGILILGESQVTREGREDHEKAERILKARSRLEAFAIVEALDGAFMATDPYEYTPGPKPYKAPPPWREKPSWNKRSAFKRKR